ncbi:MAG TPA: hypothetical protein VGK92_01125 [Gaiellales bacterium]|jgi:hypothetical protein
MVDRIMVDPSVQLLTEADTQAPRLMPGGLCLICGTWVEHETQAAYLVTLERADGDRQEFLAHVTCLAEVAHPSSALRAAAPAPASEPEQSGTGLPEAVAGPGDVPRDYLDPKPFTADGR